MSESPKTPRLVGNLVALIGLLLGLAYLTDQLWMWLGRKPWAFCGLFPVLQLVLSHTAALVLAMVGIVLLLVSGFKHAGAVGLLVGAFVLEIAPDLLGHHLGAYCRADELRLDKHKTNDTGRRLYSPAPMVHEAGGILPPAPPFPSVQAGRTLSAA